MLLFMVADKGMDDIKSLNSVCHVHWMLLTLFALLILYHPQHLIQM